MQNNHQQGSKGLKNHASHSSGHEQLPNNLVLGEIQAMILQELSNLHKEEMIARSHSHEDLSPLSFFLNLQKPTQKTL